MFHVILLALKSNQNDALEKFAKWPSRTPAKAVGEKMHWDFSPVRSCVTDGLEKVPLILNKALWGINSLDFRQGDL